MKKRKIKLLASLTSLVLVVAVMAVGVWAATTATVNITGNVSYTAAGNVKATLTLDQTMHGIAVGTQQSAEFDGTEASAANTKELKLGTDGTVTLTPKTDAIAADIVYVYTIVVTNNAEATVSNPNLKVNFDGAATVSATAPTVIAYTYTTTSAAGTWSAATDVSEITLAPSETATIVFTLTQSANNTLNSTDIGAAIALTAIA